MSLRTAFTQMHLTAGPNLQAVSSALQANEPKVVLFRHFHQGYYKHMCTFDVGYKGQEKVY